MKIAIINGSHRENAQSAKVADHLAEVLNSILKVSDIYRFDLTNNPLPFWDEGIWRGEERWQQILNPISQQLASSDGFVVITPEWHGMVPAGLKNFFLLWGNNELAHKPALIVGVSAGAGGAYPVAELRMSSYKNNRICYIPEQLIIRDVEKVFNSEGENDPTADAYYRERAEYALGVLIHYTQAMAGMRQQPGLFNAKFKNGM